MARQTTDQHSQRRTWPLGAAPASARVVGWPRGRLSRSADRFFRHLVFNLRAGVAGHHPMRATWPP